MKAGLATVAAFALAFVATTWWALESGGVAVIETRTGEGIRSTHVWYVEPHGELWLEAGTPENPWLLDVQQDPRVRFTGEGSPQEYLAEPLDDPDDHARVRALLREKYGFRDWWVGLLVDVSRSQAVRLVAPRDG